MSRQSSSDPVRCRVCGHPAAREAGEVEYFEGYAWGVFDCLECRCRFTQHDTAVHNLFHESGATSYYRDYRTLTSEAKRLFDQRDVEGLKHFLSKAVKYQFVINELESVPRSARLLEVGCSRGYLTSWFILAGWNITGMDVSEEALESARAAFGDHFVPADSPAIAAGAPYDVIYHLGMIGCVNDPVGHTKHLLSMLRPGGRLLFNAPNLTACRLRNQLWFDTAPPPDLVTLFPPGFWTRQFDRMAMVREAVELEDADTAISGAMRRIFRGGWTPPRPRRINETVTEQKAEPSTFDRILHLFERGAAKLARITGLSRLAPRHAREFGLYVKMTPRTTAAADATAGGSLPQK